MEGNIEDISFAATSFSPTAESNSELTIDEKIDAGIEDALRIYFNLLQSKSQYGERLVDLSHGFSSKISHHDEEEENTNSVIKFCDDLEKDPIYETVQMVAESNPRIKSDANGTSYCVPEGLFKLFTEAYSKYKIKICDVLGEAQHSITELDHVDDPSRFSCHCRICVWKEAESRRLHRVRKIDFKINSSVAHQTKEQIDESVITQNQTPEPQTESSKTLETLSHENTNSCCSKNGLKVNGVAEVNDKKENEGVWKELWSLETGNEGRDSEETQDSDVGQGLLNGRGKRHEKGAVLDARWEYKNIKEEHSQKDVDNNVIDFDETEVFVFQTTKSTVESTKTENSDPHPDFPCTKTESFDSIELNSSKEKSSPIINPCSPGDDETLEKIWSNSNPEKSNKESNNSDKPNQAEALLSSTKRSPKSSKNNSKKLDILPRPSCLNCSKSDGVVSPKGCKTCSPQMNSPNQNLEFPSTSKAVPLLPSPEANARSGNRRLERPRSVNVTGFWICRLCTLQNPLNVHRCEVCRYDKNKDVKYTHAQIRRKWSCEKCTFKNPLKLDNCEMCQTPKTLSSSEKEKGTITSTRLRSIYTAVLNSKKGMKQKYHEIVAFCNKAGDYFVDDSFPPAPKSLYYNPKQKSESGTDLVSQWIRPKDILTEQGTQGIQWATYRTPLPSDISQGVLGNCWLLSALAVIAERKELIEKILITPDISSAGAYLIRLCKDGSWVDIFIDDLLPCDKKKNLVYSQAKRKQLWVPLIEKAVAKLHGCYEALVSGRAIEGLATLTGYPCESISLQGGGDEELDRDLVWAQLLSCYTARFLMGASCGGGNMKVDEEEYRDKGLRPRHAYSVLNVYGSNGLRLLRLRNPWGRYSWKGDYCDGWSGWTPELRNSLMPHGSDDGVFWISFDDMLRFFDCIDVCKVRDFWYERRIQGQLPPAADSHHLSCILITVMEPTEIEISLFQQDHRKSEKSQRSPLDLCVVLFRGLETSQSDSQKLVLGKLVEHSKRQVRGFVGCHKMVETGFYLAVPLAFNHWHGMTGTPHDYVMSIHSSKKVLADKIAPPAYMLADAMIRLTMERGQRHEGRECMTAYYLTKGWAGLVVVVENRHDDKWIQIKCDCRESYNVVSTRGQLKTVDAVPPLNRQVIIILTQLEGSGGFSIAHRLTHRPSLTNGLHDWGPSNVNHWPVVGEDVEGLHSPRPI